MYIYIHTYIYTYIHKYRWGAWASGEKAWSVIFDDTRLLVFWPTAGGRTVWSTCARTPLPAASAASIYIYIHTYVYTYIHTYIKEVAQGGCVGTSLLTLSLEQGCGEQGGGEQEGGARSLRSTPVRSLVPAASAAST
jgi:hypothetical protein